METEKIGMDELLEIKRSGRRTYVILPGLVVSTFDLRPGDRLRVKIKEVLRTGERAGPRDE